MLRQAAARVHWPCAVRTRHVRWPVAARLRPLPRQSSTLASQVEYPIERNEVNSTTNNPPLGPPPAQQGQPVREPQQTRDNRGAQEAQNASAPSSSSSGWTLPADRLSIQMPGLVRQAKELRIPLDRLVNRFAMWDARFRTIKARVEGGGKGKGLPLSRKDRIQLSALLRHETVADMRTYWFSQPRATRDRDWLSIMGATLDFHPDRAAQVLEATFEDDVAPYWAVSDVLCFLAGWTFRLAEPERRRHQNALSGLILHLLRNSRPQSLQFQQWVLGQIVSGCNSARKAANICSALEQYGHPIHFNTKLKIADRLAHDRKYTLLALRLLESVISDDGLSANDPRCAALATSLFKLPPEWDTGRAPPVEINLIAESYQRLVGLGFSPNAITSTALIQSLCSTDQLKTAFKIFDVMRGQWIDDGVYSVLLKGARRARSLDAIIRVFQHAPRAILRQSNIWDSLLHTIHSAARKEAREKRCNYVDGTPAFHSMLQVYCKYFDLPTLQRIIPMDLSRYLAEGDQDSSLHEQWDWKAKLDIFLDKLPRFPRGHAVHPSGRTLGIMLLGYHRTFPQTSSAMEFYSHFQKLLRDRDRLAVRLLRSTTLPYDVVLKTLAEHRGMLRVMTDIVRDMLKNAANSATFVQQQRAMIEDLAASIPPDSDTPKPRILRMPPPKPDYQPPSVCTWSILLYAFSRERGPRNAARILNLMRENNVEPNRATWNTIAHGYGCVQDRKRLAGALHLLEADGYHPDAHTIRAVTKLRRRAGGVLEQMEARMEQRGEEYLQMVAALATPPPKLIQEWGEQRARRLAEAFSSPDGQQQAAEYSSGNERAKQTLTDAELEKSLKELEDAHEAMLRAAEAAAQKDPVSQAVQPAVRAASRKNPKNLAAESEEVAAYMEMYDELVFAQMREELTGFDVDAEDKSQEEEGGSGEGEVVGEGRKGEEGSVNEAAEDGEQQPQPQDTEAKNPPTETEEPQETERGSVGEDTRKEPHAYQDTQPERR